MRYDGGDLPYEAGDIVLMPPMIYHQNDSSTGFTNIHLNVDFASLSLTKPALIRDDSNHFILDAFNAAFYHFGRSPANRSLLLSAYGNLIVSLILDALNTPLRNPTVDQIIRSIIASYPDENFELDQYLLSQPFNYDYIRKLFKRETGMTPHRFLSETRLQAAAERLRFNAGSPVNISDIAHLCGFRDPLYFSKIFRKKYGLSPSQYQSGAVRPSELLLSEEQVKIFPSPDA